METRSMVHIVRTLPWQMRGGMETHGWQLAQAWRKRGWDIDLITTSFQDKDYVEDRDGVRIHYLRHLPNNRDEIPMWRWWHRFAERASDYAIARKARPEIAHSESLYGHPLFRHLRKNGGASRCVATIHGIGLQVYRDNGRPQLLQRVSRYHPRAIGQWALVHGRAFLERTREFPTADRVVTVSEVLAECLRKDYRVPDQRLDVIPNGVLPPHRPDDRHKLRQRLGLPTDARLLLYLGRVEVSKGIEKLWPHLREHARDRLVVAGQGADVLRLKALANGLPNPAQVRFLDEVPDDLKQRLLAAADLLVLPSESEGQPIVLLEALSHGTPAYTTRPWVPYDVRDLIAHGPNVSEGIEDAARKTAAVRAQADRVARDYSWDRIAQRYEAVFDRAKT